MEKGILGENVSEGDAVFQLIRNENKLLFFVSAKIYRDHIVFLLLVRTLRT